MSGQLLSRRYTQTDKQTTLLKQTSCTFSPLSLDATVRLLPSLPDGVSSGWAWESFVTLETPARQLRPAATALKLQMQTVYVTLLLWESSAARPVHRRPRRSANFPQKFSAKLN